ncbi:unnamed protein product [Acanthoscelides obtectus]|uniref:Uncharacterized protein n=1 Tax=Acanthoscelides obtectus TaxID=200917 RepID=A0A9P0VUU4_ACAOB|nr:unnamed protein product [Acanthoscelides obtectus]CAK1682765.1 Protein fem-1 homolog B [Acanthoscelides obtectus]
MKELFKVIKEQLDIHPVSVNYSHKLLKQCSEEEKFNIGRRVFTLNQLQVTLRDGQSLLTWLAMLKRRLMNSTPMILQKTIMLRRVKIIHDGSAMDRLSMEQFPCADTTKLLIKCGADVNAMDGERNTPLHVIVNYHKAISDFMTLYTIITALTDGALIWIASTSGGDAAGRVGDR